ncbi:MAG: 50S ribosomal protein L32 [Candidatus Aureabacteria bacterium]|nr:50S ribosomal protein L32 [Candidatus Auribacterota bacterium]
MAVPKTKLSKTRTLSRRAHDFLTPPETMTCPNCGELKAPHRACRHCGHYKGMQYKVAITEINE